MLKNILILPDGTEISSGVGHFHAIRSVSLTECVNSGEELTIGSVCANMMEAQLLTPGGSLDVMAGEEVTLVKVDDSGHRYNSGIFCLEKPTRPSANLMKLTGYDRVAKLDKDLTQWLHDLTGWPYPLRDFAGMVCQACGLTLAEGEIPNGDYPVPKFAVEATGRQLMQWIGEICCRFCRANADGEMEFAWYTPAGVSVMPSGGRYFFQGTLTYEDYRVAPIEAVQMKLTDHEDGALWPVAEAGANSYIISGNPILMAAVTAKTETALHTIQAELAGMTYTPCKVSLPASLDIRAGHTVEITDRNGTTITACVMTKTQKGQRDTLECTGSPRRDSSTAQHNKPPSQVARETAAREIGKLTQEELMRRLTKDWTDDGLYLTEDGKLAVKATAILAGILASLDGSVQIDLSENRITCSGKDPDGKDVSVVIHGSTLRMEREGGALGFLLEALAAGVHLYSSQYMLLDGLLGTELGNEESQTLVKGSRVRLNAPRVDLMGYDDGTDTCGVYLNGKKVDWKRNSDGTFTLIGTEVAT